ncbi:MAG: Fic family protein [Desulfobulbaceae bacterium]|nr:Fic family protein [Desulfobulbaceae bacterium]
MNHRNDTHDREYLKQLQQDFSVDVPSPLSTSKALTAIYARYGKLNSDAFIIKLSTIGGEQFTAIFSKLPLILHRYLFAGILSNFDKYRISTDPGDGAVFFGPDQRFPGAPPDTIEQSVREACSVFVIDPMDAPYNAVKFYQQFVMIHPFYDANGRIGRFMVEVYLNFHGWGISWEKLCTNEQWIKKLNDCHKRFEQPVYDHYVDLLVNHWKKFIFTENV